VLDHPGRKRVMRSAPFSIAAPERRDFFDGHQQIVKSSHN
jgi:hypothetical protein